MLSVISLITKVYILSDTRTAGLLVQITGDSILVNFQVHCVRMRCRICWDGTPFWDFFAALKMFLWAGTMVHLTAVTLMYWRKLIFWWLLRNIGGTFVAEGSNCTLAEIALFWPLFVGGSLHKNGIVGFDENLAVVSWCDLQQCVMLQYPPKR